MYKIINTTDGRFIGREVNIDKMIIILDDFIFNILKIIYKKETIELSNFNYIIEVKLISELENYKIKK